MNLDSGIAQVKKTQIYLFPGQGSDFRIFHKYNWGDNYDTICMNYPIPNRNETMKQFAERFVPLIDTNRPYILIGVSIGGMICTELADTLNPEIVILLSSAKTTKELPNRYTFQKTIPLNRIVPKKLIRRGALTLQPIVEKDSRNDELFKKMIKIKDPTYLKRTVNMIINWKREQFNQSIIHIHGEKDKTLPIRNVKADYIIKDGSHMMTLTRAEEINEILNMILNNQQAN